jgi:hypothetical protein
MKQHLGNHIGIVVNSTDPEYRGRVQVFVPHIMPAIYEGWNEDGEDIEISCVGSNIPEGLTPEIHARLVKILPWAEAASPIIGSSAPGNLFSDITSAVKGAAGAAYSAVAGAVNHAFNQGPTSEPVTVEGGDAQALINKAKGIANLDYDPNITADSSHKPGSQWGMCARGTTGLDKAAGLIDNNGPSAGFNAASDLAAGGSLFNQAKSGNYINPYITGTGAKHFQPAFTVNSATYKPQVGDSVFAGGGGGADNGHAQKCVGFDKSGKAVWVSDNPQTHFFTENKTASYNNFTVYRLNDEGLAKYTASIGGKITGQEAPSSGSSQHTADANKAAPNNLARSDGKPEAVPAPQSNLVVNPEAGMTGTISGGGTVSNTTGFSDNELKFAMRIAAGESGAGILNNAYSEATDPSKAIANTYFKEYQSSGLGVKAFAQQKITAGAVDWKKVDIGYVQSNEYDKGQKGAVNTGSYKDQIVGTAQAIRNLSAKNPALGSQVTESIKSGNFAKADEILGSRGGGSIGTKYYALKDQPGKMSALEERINKDFGGNVNAALDGINNELPPVPTVAEISSGAYDPNAPVGTPNRGIVTAGVPSIVNNTDSNGRTPVINTNDMASGLFTYPNPGAMVWVFFREGNPLFPVYFAASYSSAEWKSAYRGGSPAEAYTNDGKTIGRGTVAKFGEEGGILTQSMTNMSDALNNSSSLSLFHQHGSNITMKDGCDFYFSRNNKRDEVDNDRFIITKGYKEEWIEGDASTNTRGNLIVKVGNISAEAIAAMQELSDMSYEMNQMLMDKPKGGSGGSGGAKSAAKTEATPTNASTSTPANSEAPVLDASLTKQQPFGGFGTTTAQFKDSIKAAPVQTVPGVNTVSKGAYSMGVDIQKPISSYNTSAQSTNSAPKVELLRERFRKK